MSPKTEAAREILRARKVAYAQTLNPESEAVKALLQDLAKFCRADESCFHVDPRAHAVLEGRREVWLRIQDHLKLSVEELLKKYGSEGTK